ncbi:acetylornithine deacetylase [Bacillus pakistanensis]|uniref:Acetylornithine deacetylase n=1 Tax=Rossellomorea pakistanensis TaxID=992288 RepID=A0ABS2N8Y2_9BACI|nr:acetylornithine deacetylase [Bacillus pakistanensis]
MNLPEKIHRFIHSQQPKTIELLQRLVQEESTRENESSAQAIVIEKCRELKLDLDIWEIERIKLQSHPFFRCDRNEFEGNPNVVATLKGNGGGRSIILNGHIDVVPEGDPKDWRDDPFSGRVSEGKLYGRGSTDMKGGNVALLLAIEAIISTGIKLKGDVIFQSVIEEESGGTGTLAALLRGYKADAAIIPEPTNMKLFPKQQGSMWFRIKVKGKSAHGGTRYEGVNAIEKAMKVISSLRELEIKRNEEINDPLYQSIPIPVPINIGRIECGKWPSSVPDLAIIEGRVGVAPHETLEEVENDVENWLRELKEQDEWFKEFPVELEWFGGRWQPGNLDHNHELMNTIKSAYREILNSEPIVEASPWGTDGGILSKGANIPVVVFGPGTTEVAHDSNEYIELEKVFQSAEIIAVTLLSWCGVDL